MLFSETNFSLVILFCIILAFSVELSSFSVSFYDDKCWKCFMVETWSTFNINLTIIAPHYQHKYTPTLGVWIRQQSESDLNPTLKELQSSKLIDYRSKVLELKKQIIFVILYLNIFSVYSVTKLLATNFPSKFFTRARSRHKQKTAPDPQHCRPGNTRAIKW